MITRTTFIFAFKVHLTIAERLHPRTFKAASEVVDHISKWKERGMRGKSHIVILYGRVDADAVLALLSLFSLRLWFRFGLSLRIRLATWRGSSPPASLRTLRSVTAR